MVSECRNPATAPLVIPPSDQCLQNQAYPISDSTHDTVPGRASEASWSLAKYLSLEKIFSSAYRIVLSLNVGYPAVLLLAPTEFSGLNLPCFSDLAQLQKRESINRAFNLGGEPRLAGAAPWTLTPLALLYRAVHPHGGFVQAGGGA
jgi:hypothetical protein